MKRVHAPCQTFGPGGNNSSGGDLGHLSLIAILFIILLSGEQQQKSWWINHEAFADIRATRKAARSQRSYLATQTQKRSSVV